VADYFGEFVKENILVKETTFVKESA
jgi:hypothetical protein